HHSIGVEEKTIRNYPQTIDAILCDLWISGIEPDDLWGKDFKQNADYPKKDHVVKTGFPNCTFCPLRISRAKRLPNHRGSSIRHSPRGQKSKKDDSYSEGISSYGVAAEGRNGSHKSYPTRHANEDLKSAGSR